MSQSSKTITIPDSYVNKKGSWDTRKISLWGAAHSVISQLTDGTDLTRVILPADFQAPYSLLELCAARYLGYMALLRGLESENAMERMNATIRWYLACTMELKFVRKPYNSDKGETHTVSSGTATFYAQQMSHHPPITAFAILDPTHNIELQGNMGADIHFQGNSVLGETTGFVEITYKNEKYHISKGLPTMVINNVIWGKRSMNWGGEVDISCNSTNLYAKLMFSGNGTNKNFVKGVVLKKDDQGEVPLYEFLGNWVKEPLICMDITFETGMNKVPLFIPTEITKDTNLSYPNKSDPMETLNIWKDVTYYIVNEDLPRADEANNQRRINARQRSAMQDPLLERNYFKLEEGTGEKKVYVLNYEGLKFNTSSEDTKETTTEESKDLCDPLQKDTLPPAKNDGE